MADSKKDGNNIPTLMAWDGTVMRRVLCDATGAITTTGGGGGGSSVVNVADAVTPSRLLVVNAAGEIVVGLNAASLAALETITVITPTSSTGTQTSVASSATDVTILAANASRQGAGIYNDSTQVLYLLVGSGTSSVTAYTVQLAAGAYYEVPARYTGVLKGLWASANGNARVTEWA